MYFNYHAKIKKLILNNQLLNYIIVENWNGIKPAMVFFFKNNKPMPVRINKWQEYLKILNNIGFVNNVQQ